ncbi:MAG TPA: SCO family protein [Candidatus Limnocylindrales bacterium]
MTSPSRRSSPNRLPVIASVVFAIAAAGGIGVGLLGVALGGPPATPAGDGRIAWPAATPDPLKRPTAIVPVVPAPALALTDQDGRPFDLASMRGTPALVFFGYTHCPDVCPTTLADVRDAVKRSPVPVRVVFVTIDPVRDDAAALKQYLSFYDAGFTGLTGTAAEIRRAADAWGVQYARIDNGSANGYAMAHTADAFLVDAAGRLRDRIWFGAGPDVFVDRIASLVARPLPGDTASSGPVASPPASATPAATPAAPAPPSGSPAAGSTTVLPTLTTTVIRVGANRLVMTVSDPNNRELAFPDVTAHFTFRDADPAVPPIAVDGYFIWVSVGNKGAFVVDVSFPVPGAWTGTIALQKATGPIGAADFPFSVVDRGSTPAIGDPAPSIHTPTAADPNAGENLYGITTDVFPDPRFYQFSVDQLLAAHRPFVLTFYSPAYCPTTACGPLLKNMKAIANEFPDVAFVHVEPHVMTNYGGRLMPDYSTGQLEFNDLAKAYGIPVEPFVFVVDAQGRIAASFELIVGSDEIRAAIRAATGGGA